jgi:hypothetical protein
MKQLLHLLLLSPELFVEDKIKTCTPLWPRADPYDWSYHVSPPHQARRHSTELINVQGNGDDDARRVVVVPATRRAPGILDGNKSSLRDRSGPLLC